MNWRDIKIRGPRPSVGRVNRDYGSGGPGAFRYGLSGTLNEGQNYHNSYSHVCLSLLCVVYLHLTLCTLHIGYDWPTHTWTAQ